MKTQNELYEELRALCYSIIYPEGIPLEEGCEVQINEPDIVYSFISLVMLGGVYTMDYIENGEYFWVRGDHKMDDIVKIYGKPLGLQDLLRAIERKNDIEGTCVHYYLCDDGLLLSGKKGIPEDYVLTMNLTVPLFAQEPEVLESLLNLLR